MLDDTVFDAASLRGIMFGGVFPVPGQVHDVTRTRGAASKTLCARRIEHSRMSCDVGSARRAVPQRHIDFPSAQPHADALTGVVLVENSRQCGSRVHRLAVDRGDHVTWVETGARGRTGRYHLPNDGACAT